MSHRVKIERVKIKVSALTSEQEFEIDNHGDEVHEQCCS